MGPDTGIVLCGFTCLGFIEELGVVIWGMCAGCNSPNGHLLIA